MGKSILFFLSFLFTLASANEVVLNSSRVSTDSNDVVVVRNSQTPKKVILSMPIPLKRNGECLRYETRQVYGSHPSCGVVRQPRFCRDYYGRTYNCGFRTYYRSCYHPVTFCAERGQRTVMETRQVKIVFKNVKELAPGETEKFSINGYQAYSNGYNVVYSASALDPDASYNVRSKQFFGDRIIIKK